MVAQPVTVTYCECTVLPAASVFVLELLLAFVFFALFA